MGGWYGGEWELAITLIHQDNKNSFIINPEYRNFENHIISVFNNGFNETLITPRGGQMTKHWRAAKDTKETVLYLAQWHEDNGCKIEIIENAI